MYRHSAGRDRRPQRHFRRRLGGDLSRRHPV